MGAQITNQRIGDRIPVEVADVEWRPRAKKGWRAKRTRLTARVLDVSLSGAGLLAPAEPHIPLGDTVTVVVGDREAVVFVRRRERTDDPSVLRYGVEFASLDNPLAELAAARLAELRPAQEYYWDQSRLRRTMSSESESESEPERPR